VNDEPDNDCIIDRHELRNLVPYHVTHLARMEAAGEFPKRIRIGLARVGWSLKEVRAWIEQKKRERG
jgi:prophage regulatory protein